MTWDFILTDIKYYFNIFILLLDADLPDGVRKRLPRETNSSDEN